MDLNRWAWRWTTNKFICLQIDNASKSMLESIWGLMLVDLGVDLGPDRGPPKKRSIVPPSLCSIKFISILWSQKMQKSEFNCSQGRFLFRRAHRFWRHHDAKKRGHKSHFWQNQLGIYMIFGNQHGPIMRGQDRSRQEAQKPPNERFWPETWKSKNNWKTNWFLHLLGSNGRLRDVAKSSILKQNR